MKDALTSVSLINQASGIHAFLHFVCMSSEINQELCLSNITELNSELNIAHRNKLKIWNLGVSLFYTIFSKFRSI